MSLPDRPIPFTLTDLSVPPSDPVEWKVTRITTESMHVQYTAGHEPRFIAKTAFDARRQAAVKLRVGPEDIEISLVEP